MRVKICDSKQPPLSVFILLQSDGVIRQQRWHHRYLSLPPLFFFPFQFPSSFYLFTSTSHLHSSFPTDHLRTFAAHHLLVSSPVKWSLRPVWYPDQLPPSCRSVSFTLLLIILHSFCSYCQPCFLLLAFFPSQFLSLFFSLFLVIFQSFSPHLTRLLFFSISFPIFSQSKYCRFNLSWVLCSVFHQPNYRLKMIDFMY